MIKVYAIVITYNGAAHIEKNLTSLTSSKLPLEIIVIDNDSNDNTLSIIKENFPMVNILPLKENKGFGYANNIGIKEAYESDATHFFLLNQDAWIQPETIEQLVKKQVERPSFAVLSPLHLNAAGDALENDFSNYVVPSKCPQLYSDFCLQIVKDKVYETDFVNAAAWLLNRECIEKVGGFSPTFFHYGEDDNYIHRVHYYGLKVGIYPLSIIYHDRENRGEIKYNSSYEKFKRTVLAKYSNPLKKHSIKRDRRRIIFSAMLKLLNGNIEEFKTIWKQQKTIQQLAPVIKKNLKISMEGHPLCFLNSMSFS